MPLGRTYTIDSGPVTVTTTAATPIICGATTTTNICDIECIRIGVVSGASVSYPSNGSVLVQLARAANPGAGTSITARPHNVADIAAATLWQTTFATAPTVGSILWGQAIPFTAGANWAEWVTPGAEWRVNPSSSTGAAAYVAVFVTCSAAGTATEFNCELVFSE